MLSVSSEMSSFAFVQIANLCARPPTFSSRWSVSRVRRTSPLSKRGLTRCFASQADKFAILTRYLYRARLDVQGKVPVKHCRKPGPEFITTSSTRHHQIKTAIIRAPYD